MSLENDITEIHKDIFQPASKEDAEHRQEHWKASMESKLDDLNIIRDLHQDNTGLRFTDEQWIKVLTTYEQQNPSFPISRLIELNNNIQGMLIALDDATHTTDLGIIKKTIIRR